MTIRSTLSKVQGPEAKLPWTADSGPWTRLGRRLGLWAGLAALGLVVALALLVDPYFVDIMTRTLVFAVLAMGLNLLVGYTGLPSLGQAAFMAMGAYTAAILVKKVGVDHVLASLLAVLAAGALGALFGLIALRARGGTFLLITLALAQSTWAVAFTWRPVTGGDDGMGGITRPSLGPLPVSLDDSRAYFFLSLAIFLALLWVFNLLVHSPFGLALKGVRENELRMRSLSYNTWLLQYGAFIVAALFAGVAGVMRVFLTGAIVPSWADVTPSAEALLMVIMGGPGTVIGPLIGAAIIVPTGQVAGYFTSRWQLVLGAIYVVVILFAPEGLVGWARRRFARGRVP